VTMNGSTTLRATATDAAGNTSGCSTSQLIYVHDSMPPAAPTGLGVAPSSPANENNPVVSGGAEASSTVKIFKDSACTMLAATGAASGAGGFAITVPVVDNSSSTFYATATDAAGNASACSTSSVAYVEDSAAPT